MGGALAIASSVLVPGVDAVVAFYGVPSPELADPVNAKAPVQAHFGEDDGLVGFSDVKVYPTKKSFFFKACCGCWLVATLASMIYMFLFSCHDHEALSYCVIVNFEQSVSLFNYLLI